MATQRKKKKSEPTRKIRASPVSRISHRDRATLQEQGRRNSRADNSTPTYVTSDCTSGLFFESPAVRAWYSGSDILPAAINTCVLPARGHHTGEEGGSASSLADVRRTKPVARSGTSCRTSPQIQGSRRRTDNGMANIYTERELLEIDDNMAFAIPTTDQGEKLTAEAVSYMEKAWDETEVCCVCELVFPRTDVEIKQVTDEFVELMRLCLKVHPDAEVPTFVANQYDASTVDPRLHGLLLQRTALFTDGDRIWMKLCATCSNHIQSQKYTVPPACAISNGNYIGHLPAQFEALTRTDEQAVALVLPCVSMSVVSGGSCKTIKSHHYVVQNTEGPISEMLPRNLSTKVRVTMVGSMTSAQVASCKKRYKLNVDLCRIFIAFLDRWNREYKTRSLRSSTSVLRTSSLIPTSVIIDRTDTYKPGQDSEDVVATIRDDGTYSTFGSTVEEGHNSTIEHTWIASSSLLLQPQQHSWADILVRKSNVYMPMTKWAVCVKMFPTLFPGGCGGPDERRLTPMSVRKWILRCLQIDGHRFETHHAFMLLAFDFLASENARRTLYVKMNVKRQALKAAEISRSTIKEAITYFNHLTECRSRGVKPRPPSLEVQRVIDLRKGLHVPESSFYGSNSGRMRARHDLFGLLKRFGPLQLFFTVSPDSAGTYNIAIKSGRVTEQVLKEANLELLPNRAERKAIAATYPVESARYFLRVMDTIVEVLLGWDSKAHAPKRGGGIFGVVRAFGAATETQLSGVLHVHIAVWLHGFPTTSELYNVAMESDSTFRQRIISFADSILSTKPPCLVDELKCPNCQAENTLQPITPGIDAFRRPVAGSSPPATSQCSNCHQIFRDKDIIDRVIQTITGEQPTHVDSDRVEFEKCRPPQPSTAGMLTTSLLVRDLQVTVRTPKGSVCRFLKPEKVCLGPTTIEDGYKLRLHRAIGCEYVNAYNPVVMTALKCNHDAQFVISTGAKHTAAYVVKYCCKNQNPVENYAALALAAFAKAAKKTNELPPETPTMERGYRILGSMLYSVTNGQEVAATMAALYILRGSPFWFSHEFFHLNLKNFVYKQLDSTEVIVSQEVSANGQTGLARVSTENILERYWRRDSKLDTICFMEICEHYEYLGRKTVKVRSNVVSFTRTQSRKVVVLCGDEIPDISTNLDQSQIDYYYLAVLTLFKPHRKSELLGAGQTPLQSYRLFVQLGKPDDVRRLKRYEAQWRDYYQAQRGNDKVEESAEELLLRTRAPPTSSSLMGSGDTRCHRSEDVEPMDEPIPDDFEDSKAIISPNSSTSKLLADADTTTEAVPNLRIAISSACKRYASSNCSMLPVDFTFESYATRIIKPCGNRDQYGTEEFIKAFPTKTTRLERLEECYGPVPFLTPPLESGWTAESLPPFPTIAMVSGAFRLNFWQHVIFELVARHLLYAYSKDIESATTDEMQNTPPVTTPLYGIKPQLIAYLGGQAGTGKSTVVEALLALAKEWGRAGSVETLAFTGAAAINIHGRTMHSARNLKLNGAEPNSPPSTEMKSRFSQVLLVIIDEISIADQALLGGTDSVSRQMSPKPEKFMGGKHVLLLGDFLQLPPIGGHPCFQIPSCTASRLRHAGYALYSAINMVVFLTKNMRARTDPIYAEILDSLRWGRLSDHQIDVLNTRVESLKSLEVTNPPANDLYYRPFVVCTNKLRCAINSTMIFQIATSLKLTVYECLALPTSRSKAIVDNISNLPDDLTDRVPIKLLFYIGMPVMLTRKHPLLLDADVIANGVVGSIVGTYPAPNELETTRYSVEGVIIHRLVQRPQLLLIKLFGHHTTLVAGFEEGVVGLPLLHTRLQLKNIPNLAQSSVTVDQFAAVPAFSCTTEKLQGQTCHNGVVVTPLKRQRGTANQTLYVALSRAVSLNGLTLTQEITKEYLNNFKPNEATVTEIQRLIQLVALPPYASTVDQHEFNQWKAQQHT